MLKGIPAIIPPELMKILMEMGHGDELLICDGNYPKFGCPERCVRMDGHGIPEILDAILKFFPLDPYVENPTILMAGSTLAMIPMLVLYLIFQRQFIEGIALTGTKG